jgi:hypothetical protein
MVDMVVDDAVVAPIAVAEVASVVDIGVEVVRIVATVELTPRMYLVVAIVVVEIPGLVAVASCTLPVNVTPYTLN